MKFNLKLDKIEKESALFADQMMRQYLWDYLAKNYQMIDKAKSDKAYKVLNQNPPASYDQIKQIFDSIVGNVPSDSPSDRTTQDPQVYNQKEMNESSRLFQWQNFVSRFPQKAVDFDTANNRIIIEGLSLDMLPSHERGILQQAFGNLLVNGPDSISLPANPNVYKKFREYARMFMPRGVDLPLAGDIKIQDKSMSSHLSKNDNEIVNDLPFNKNVKARIQQQLVWDKNKETSQALIIDIDPHSSVLHGNDVSDDLELFLSSNNFSKKLYRINPRGEIVIFLNVSTRGDVENFKPSDEAFKTVANLVDFLNKNGFNTQEISNVMSQFGTSLDTKLNTIKTVERKAPLTDKEIAMAIKKNQNDSLKLLAAHEGFEFDPKNPESAYKLIEHVSQKVRNSYPNGFNNDIFPEDMKKKQAEAIARGVSLSSVVMGDQPGSGKCVDENTLCLYNGKILPISKIWQNSNSEPTKEADGEVKPIDGTTLSVRDNQIIDGKVVGIYRELYSGKMYEYTTNYGKKIIATPSHKFLTPLGLWENSLKYGDCILSPCKIEEPLATVIMDVKIADNADCINKKSEMPFTFLQSSNKVVKIILRSCFDQHGWVDKKGSICIKSNDAIFIRQVEFLLKRFGIFCSLKTKNNCEILSIVNSDKFILDIGFTSKEKEKAWEAFWLNGKEKFGLKPLNVHLYPFFKKYKFSKELFGITDRAYITGKKWANEETLRRIIKHFQMLLDGSLKKSCEQSGMTEKAIRINMRVFDNVDLQDVELIKDKLSQMLYDNFVYEKIISVKEIQYNQYIYDLTVLEDHNYLAGGLLSHNTFMSAAVADYYTKMLDNNNGKKNQILIISPSGLVSQNWTTRAIAEGETPDPKKHVQINNKWYTPSAPRQFLDPKMEFENGNDKEVQVISDWGQSIGDARWVVMNYNLFTDAGDPKEKEALLEEKKVQLQQEPGNKAAITQQIKEIKDSIKISKSRMVKIKSLINDIKNKKFAIVMLDEAQLVKNDEARRSNYIHNAISGIGRVVAMTGTPADDNPSDLYGCLKLIKHPLIKPPGRESQIDRTSFADQFFGGFGVKGRNFNTQDFEDSIPQRVQETIKLLDILAQFFVRREKEDINPLMYEKKNIKNPINKIIDANGNEISVDESSYPDLKEQALNDAAWRKAARQKAKGNLDMSDDTEQTLHNMEEDQISTMDVDDLGDDDEYIDINGVQVSADEQKRARIAISNNPAEEQEAVLRHFAMLKVPTTVSQAVSVLNSGFNIIPPKIGEEVVALDKDGAIIDSGILKSFEPVVEQNGLNSTRKVFANIDSSGHVKRFPRNFVVSANPKQVNKKVFIVTKSIDAAFAIKDLLVNQLGEDAVAVVSGKEANFGKRTEITERFKDASSPLRVLVMTMKLGAVGFNFQVADTVIFNDVSWNPSENEQASDRVYRITSPRDVKAIYNYLNVGEDSKMVSMIEAKEESNKNIQKCIKMAYEWKKTLLSNPTEYNEKMAEAATQFLKELAESMRQHTEAKKIRNGVQRKNISNPSELPAIAAKTILSDNKKPNVIAPKKPDELFQEAEELIDNQRYEEAKQPIQQLVDSERQQNIIR